MIIFFVPVFQIPDISRRIIQKKQHKYMQNEQKIFQTRLEI